MKLIILSVLAAVSIFAIAEANLREDFERIGALVPKEELKNVTRYFLRHDSGVRQVFHYSVRSKVAKRARRDIAGDADVQALVQWVKDHLKDNGEPENLSEDPVEPFSEPQGVDEFNPLQHNQGLGGWPAYAKAVYDCLHVEDLHKLCVQLIEEKRDFAELYNLVKSHRETYERLIGLRSVALHIEILRSLKVDVDAADRAIRKVFQWED